MVGVNLTRQSIGILSTIILARLLPPEDFGLVAMATVLMLMMQAMTEFGFDVVLIQKQSATKVVLPSGSLMTRSPRELSP